MIASGFALWCFGLFIGVMWGSPGSQVVTHTDKLSGFSMLVGILVFFAGIVRLLWDHLP